MVMYDMIKNPGLPYKDIVYRQYEIGGNYTPLLRDGNHVYISGQIPRVGDAIVLPGKVAKASAWPTHRLPRRSAAESFSAKRGFFIARSSIRPLLPS